MLHTNGTRLDRVGTNSKGQRRYPVVSILEVVWKVVGTVIYTRILKVVQFHNVLHGFHKGGGTGTKITELKLAKELASVDQDPLLLVLIDLRKDCDNLDCGRLLQTLAR